MLSLEYLMCEILDDFTGNSSDSILTEFVNNENSPLAVFVTPHWFEEWVHTPCWASCGTPRAQEKGLQSWKINNSFTETRTGLREQITHLFTINQVQSKPSTPDLLLKTSRNRPHHIPRQSIPRLSCPLPILLFILCLHLIILTALYTHYFLSYPVWAHRTDYSLLGNSIAWIWHSSLSL